MLKETMGRLTTTMTQYSVYTIFFVLVFTSFGQCSLAAQLNDDVLGLMMFKTSLLDPTNALRSWNQDDDNPCYWTGIVCDAQNNRVTSVQLQGLSLSGRIGKGLNKLEYLQTLSLANNNISGTISIELAQLQQLRKLDLSHNTLSGRIPPVLGSLSSLKMLDVSSNSLTGPLPAELFSNCNALHYLSLASNYLSGPIPDSIGACSALNVLNLSSNHLKRAVPASMGTLSSLTVLDLSFNAFSGSLPSFLPNMLEVRLQNNRFRGPLPAQIGTSTGLKYLDLSNNLITGLLPDSMKNLQSLASLNLANNLMSSGIPTWIGSLASLEILSFAHNLFQGELPDTLGLLKSVQEMDFSYNILSGEIPSSLSGCDQLKILDLSSNIFSGSVPDALPPSIASLRLSYNQLTDQLPVQFCSQCTSLQVLDLSQNQLFGPMPLLASCPKLQYLNMSYNIFSGSIPTVWQSGSYISVIDLSHNELFGSIPLEVGQASNLSVLLLNDNKLNGSIPSELGNCSTLTQINLAKNNISGTIPPAIGNLINLELLDVSYNDISGSIPIELGQLERLTTLNLSYNKLQGPIPEFGNLFKFNETAFAGNEGLCGANVNITCSNAVPKPIVLNPNGFPIEPTPLPVSVKHKHIELSTSAILAISAGVAIVSGVVIVLILNMYAQARRQRSHETENTSTISPSLDLPIGKLVMFSQQSDPKSEEWVPSAHALLKKEGQLGRGGFGRIYKAVLADGRTVVIKKLTLSCLVKSQHDFEKEVQFIGQIKHRNLLPLQGYYWTPQLQLLIYDFIPNGNLYSRLHECSNGNSVLSWPFRFKIALGIARGLSHLHHGCNPQIIHYNVKSSNVLLDDRCNPKITDCGIANLLPMPDRYLMSNSSQNAIGYMAPEFASRSSRVDEKCDVYGYGVMLLELVTGRKPVEFINDEPVIISDYVRNVVDEGRLMHNIDPNLQGLYVEDEVIPVVKLGLICTSKIASNRPSMAEVVQILELIKTSGSSREL